MTINYHTEYDAVANLIHFESETKHNRVLEYKNLKYTYDGFGRMKTREGHHGQKNSALFMAVSIA